MTTPLEVARANRRLVAQQRATREALPTTETFIATIASVTAGGGGGGSVVQVTYHGTQIRAAGYLNSYTPTVNDRVVCVSVDAQPIILGRIIGY